MSSQTKPKSQWAILTALSHELEQTSRLGGAVEPQFKMRVFVRTMFSVFDAYAFLLSQLALAGAGAAGVTFSKRALERLQERREKVEPDGSMKWEFKFIPPRARLTAAIAAYARVRKCKAPPMEGKVAAGFDLGVVVRNRITHPKRVSDFEISKDEAEAITPVMLWFRDLAQWAGDERKYIERIKAEVTESFDREIAKLQRDSSG